MRFDLRDSIGDPRPPDSTEVLVSTESFRSFELFRGSSISFDYRSYILYGHTILPSGVRVPTRFEIDTRSPTLLAGLGIWHLDGAWYSPFSREALDRLGVSPKATRPFSWISNVPIQTAEEPPYPEGQVLHSRLPPVPHKPSPGPDHLRSFTSMDSAPLHQVGGGRLTSFQLEPGETMRFSCGAWRTGSSAEGLLVVTNRRILFCPALAHPSLEILPIEIRRREATDVGCRPMRDPCSGSALKLGLRLVLAGDREELFVVDDLVNVIEQFAKAITPIGG